MKETVSVMDIHKGDDETAIPAYDPSIPEDVERVKRQIAEYLEKGWRLTARMEGETEYRMIEAKDINDSRIENILLLRGAERLVRPALHTG